MSITETTTGECKTLTPGHELFTTTRPGILSPTDREVLANHLGRTYLHACRTRNFSTAWRNKAPRLYNIAATSITKCEYVALTHPTYAAVIIIDIDTPGQPGGDLTCINPKVKTQLDRLGDTNYPNFSGINPLTGKCQLLWMIEPVYTNKNQGTSPNMRLLKATTTELAHHLGADTNFSHYFSRNPFHTHQTLTSYRWYAHHHRVHNLKKLIQKIRTTTTTQHTVTKKEKTNPTHTTGRDLLTTVINRRQQAQAFKAITTQVETELADTLDRYDPELTAGVRILWSTPTRAARDETAFRHALKTGHRLRAAGKRLTDDALIDAYEHAYQVAHHHGADGRPNQLPPHRDRLTMARRVRAYTTRSTTKTTTITSNFTTGVATTTERKALATMGRKGGKKSAQRWKTNPNSDWAQNQRKTMKQTHQRRKASGQITRARIQAIISQAYVDTGKVPTRKEIAAEVGCTPRTVTNHLAALRKVGFLPEI